MVVLQINWKLSFFNDSRPFRDGYHSRCYKCMQSSEKWGNEKWLHVIFLYSFTFWSSIAKSKFSSECMTESWGSKRAFVPRKFTHFWTGSNRKRQLRNVQRHSIYRHSADKTEERRGWTWHMHKQGSWLNPRIDNSEHFSTVILTASTRGQKMASRMAPYSRILFVFAGYFADLEPN